MSKESDVVARIVAKSGSVYMIGLIYSYFMVYAYRLVIARWLGPSDYGLISLGFAITGLLGGIIGLGLPVGVYRYIAHYKALDKRRRLKGTFFAALKLILPLTLVLAAALFIFSEQIAINFFHNADLIPILKLFSIVLPLNYLMTSCLQVSRAFKHLKYEVYSRNFIENTVKIASTLILLYLGFDIMGAAFGYVLSILVATVAAVYFMQKRTHKLFFTKEKPIYNYKELFKYSLPLLFVSIIASIAGWLDTLFIGYFLTSKSVGFYNAALPTAQLTKIAYPALTALVIPIMTGLLAKKDTVGFKKTYKFMGRWIFIITLPLAAVMILFSRQVIQLLFGSEYVVAATSLSILTLGYLFYASTGPARNTLNAIGKTKLTLLNTVLAVLFNVAGNYFLIPLLGIVGAAIATAVSFALMNVLALIEIYYLKRIHPFSRTWIKPICSAAISLVVFYAVIKYIVLSSALTLLSGAAGFMLVYFVLLLAFKSIEHEDLVILKAIKKKTGLNLVWLENVIKNARSK